MGRVTCGYLVHAHVEMPGQTLMWISLVDMPAGSSLLDVGRLIMDLQDLLGYRVDVVEPEGLHWSRLWPFSLHPDSRDMAARRGLHGRDMGGSVIS